MQQAWCWWAALVVAAAALGAVAADDVVMPDTCDGCKASVAIMNQANRQEIYKGGSSMSMQFDAIKRIEAECNEKKGDCARINAVVDAFEDAFNHDFVIDDFIYCGPICKT